nr:meiosis-specific kinetochore protein-like isoform X2 [Odocoileus virginianus texanus]
MWSLGVYTRKKQAGGRLNLTPKPGLGAPAKAEAPSRPGRKLLVHRLKRNGKTRGLRRIAEKSERSGQGGGNSGPPSTELRVTGEKSLHENSTSEETQDEKIALLSESATGDLQTDSSSSSSKQVTGLSLQHDISGSLLSYSFTDPSTEYKSSEENLSSFPSPELFRGSDYLDASWPLKQRLWFELARRFEKILVGKTDEDFLLYEAYLFTDWESWLFYLMCRHQHN